MHGWPNLTLDEWLGLSLDQWSGLGLADTTPTTTLEKPSGMIGEADALYGGMVIG
jgi:hypothetical protein